jgi:hypothetical protein
MKFKVSKYILEKLSYIIKIRPVAVAFCYSVNAPKQYKTAAHAVLKYFLLHKA